MIEAVDRLFQSLETRNCADRPAEAGGRSQWRDCGGNRPLAAQGREATETDPRNLESIVGPCDDCGSGPTRRQPAAGGPAPHRSPMPGLRRRLEVGHGTSIEQFLGDGPATEQAALFESCCWIWPIVAALARNRNHRSTKAAFRHTEKRLPEAFLHPLPLSQWAGGGRAPIHIRCPHCHKPVEIVDRADWPK